MQGISDRLAVRKNPRNENGKKIGYKRALPKIFTPTLFWDWRTGQKFKTKVTFNCNILNTIIAIKEENVKELQKYIYLGQIIKLKIIKIEYNWYKCKFSKNTDIMKSPWLKI